MGRGRVDPAPPAPINSDPKGRRKKEKNGRKQGRRAEKKKTETVREWGERQRPRERQLFFWERKGRTKGRKPQVIFERKEE
jgi:hypothetical protein